MIDHENIITTSHYIGRIKESDIDEHKQRAELLQEKLEKSRKKS